MPDVYVRLREAGLEDGEPIPADGTVALSPVHVVDPDAWVTAAATVLHVRDGAAAPVSVSAGRWRVIARSRSWERSWVLDLVDGDTPVNLVSLTPVDPSTPVPWLPTESDLAFIRETRERIPDLIEAAVAEGDYTGPAGRGVVSIEDDDGDGTATVTYTDGETAPLPLPTGSGGGSGIEEVSGEVTLDPDGPRIRELYTVGVATIGGEDFEPDTALAVRRLASGSHEVAVVGEVGGWRAFGEEPVGPEPGDTTPPTAGTMTVTVAEDSITGTVSGAMDETALHESPYRFSLDAGGSWSGWQADPVFVWEGLTPSTEYPLRHEVRDASGNTRLGAVVTASTTAVPTWVALAEESFAGVPDGAFPDGRTIPGTAGLTWGLTGDWGAPIVGERIDFAPETNTTVHTLAASRTTSTMNDVRLSADYTCPEGTRRHGGAVNLSVDLNEAGTVNRSAIMSATIEDLTAYGVSVPESGTLAVHWSPRKKIRRVLLNGEEIHSEVHTGSFAAAYGMGVRFTRGAFTIDNIRYEEAVL